MRRVDSLARRGRQLHPRPLPEVTPKQLNGWRCEAPPASRSWALAWYNTRVSTHDVDGLNAGYARALLDEYLENPEAVPSEWRALFESGDSGLVASHPGIARLLEALPQSEPDGNGQVERPAPLQVEVAELPSDRSCSGAWPPRWRSSRPTAPMGTSLRGSIRSGPSRSATPRSSLCGSSRS